MSKHRPPSTRRPSTPSTSQPERSPASKKRSGGEIPEEFTEATRGERLQKVLAEADVASRRECERLIANGHVRVNRKLVTALPAWVDPRRDRITIDGKPVHLPQAKPQAQHQHAKLVLALNKPRGIISTTRDERGRRTVLDLVRFPEAPRLFPVGRLDADSAGLILLTNDGDLAQHLTHPRYGVDKEYEVTFTGELTDDDIAKLKKGLFLTQPRGDSAGAQGEAGQARAVRARMERVEIVSRSRGRRQRSDGEPIPPRTRVRIILREGKNREIRRMLARLGFKVHRLERVRIGPLKVKGLARGEWRVLSTAEVNRLRKASGPREA